MDNQSGVGEMPNGYNLMGELVYLQHKYAQAGMTIGEFVGCLEVFKLNAVFVVCERANTEKQEDHN